MRRLLMTGLATMAGAALAAAIWPAVASVVFCVLVAELSAVAAVPAALTARWIRGELAWRRELRAMPAVGAAADATAPVVPTLAELRDSA